MLKASLANNLEKRMTANKITINGSKTLLRKYLVQKPEKILIDLILVNNASKLF